MATEMNATLKEYYDSLDNVEIPTLDSSADDSIVILGSSITIPIQPRKVQEAIPVPEQAEGSKPTSGPQKDGGGSSAEKCRERTQTDYRKKYCKLKQAVQIKDEKMADLQYEIVSLKFCLREADKEKKANEATWKSRRTAWQESYIKLEEKQASTEQLCKFLYKQIREGKIELAGMKRILRDLGNASFETLFDGYEEDPSSYSLNPLDMSMLDITGVSSPRNDTVVSLPDTPNSSK